MSNYTLKRFVIMLNIISAVAPSYAEKCNRMIEFLEKENDENEINWEIKCLLNNLFLTNTDKKLDDVSIDIYLDDAYSDSYEIMFYDAIGYIIKNFTCYINTFKIPRVEPIKHIDNKGNVNYSLYVSNNSKTIFPKEKYGINVITCRDIFWFRKSKVVEGDFLFDKEILLNEKDIIKFFNTEKKEISSIKELIKHRKDMRRKINFDYRGFIEIKELTELCDDFVFFLQENNNYNASDIFYKE